MIYKKDTTKKIKKQKNKKNLKEKLFLIIFLLMKKSLTVGKIINNKFLN
jgi:hypothetical protein